MSTDDGMSDVPTEKGVIFYLIACRPRTPQGKWRLVNHIYRHLPTAHQQALDWNSTPPAGYEYRVVRGRLMEPMED